MFFLRNFHFNKIVFSVFLFLLFFLIPVIVFGYDCDTPIIFEYNDDGDNDSESQYNTRMRAQTFKPQEDFTPQYLKLKYFKVGTPDDELQISINSTNEGLPTMTKLCYGIVNPQTFTTDTSGEWYTINLVNCPLLETDVLYSIVASSTLSSVDNFPRWRADQTGTYSRGDAYSSENSGSSWSLTGGGSRDFVFKIYGCQEEPEPTATSSFSDFIIDFSTFNQVYIISFAILLFFVSIIIWKNN